MMAPITKSRRFSIYLRQAFTCLGLVACVAFFKATLVVAQERLPLIQNLGIIPLQTEGDEILAGPVKRMRDGIEESFFTVVQRSARFRLIDNDLVSASWASPEGRRDLAETYELHAFASLNIAIKEDTLRLVARLLSPTLKTLLVESQAYSLTDFKTKNSDAVTDILRSLVFALFNRLPIDLTITSVQGRFVSLSGGEQQNVRPGDELKVHRAFIANLHPADGSWLGFRTDKQGSIRIVTVKAMTSIAQITGQSYDGAISVGDGVRLSEIPGRKHFMSLHDEPEFRDMGGDDVVVLGPGRLKKKPVEKPPMRRVEKPTEIVREAPVENVKTEESVTKAEDEPENNEDVALEPEKPNAPQVRRGEGFDYDGLFVTLGIENWSVAGGASAKAKMAIPFFNYLSLAKRVAVLGNWDVDAGGYLHFGKTGIGNFSGFGAFGQMTMPIGRPVLGGRVLRVGGDANFDTMAVTGETFGGVDVLTLGGLGRIESREVILGRDAQWNADLTLRPLGIGQAGIGGSKKSIGGFMGYGLKGIMMFYLFPSSPNASIGPGVEISGYSAKAGGKSLSYSELSLYGALKWDF